ncbi:transport protein GOS1 [Verticillium alfalfae VaMs.102]|uniref:Golgi SNAP receptor complex member 1 n=1 Tax=Verticillium alfalfae (strain VaMs.102 / ATCC MYA-4576 / FGSC 10136) TaxID=526221 RepID=C9SID6_VERA1|nr:transport protein GOS1 [Verticillium alfalfae VaMs.102]EEY18709.1 transport protein GOS1 [Verticillium alfalfae VaMs.102]
MAANSGNTGWAQLRQQARSLESQFSTVSNIPPKPTEDERATEAKLQDVLEKVPRSCRLPADPPPRVGPDPHLLGPEAEQPPRSLRDKLADHKRDLVRLRATLSQARDRANLLTNVRSDIDEYNRAKQQQDPGAAEAEYMLAERSRIDNSNSMADSVLSQAYAVQDSFNLQRESLASINRRITLAASQVPGINSLIGRISAKKRRDGIIMGAFIAFCFLCFWFFL